jgi:hypothetical protein
VYTFPLLAREMVDCCGLMASGAAGVLAALPLVLYGRRKKVAWERGERVSCDNTKSRRSGTSLHT